MKKFKKILALALSMAMVLGMSVTTFATSSNPTLEKKTDCARVVGIEGETDAQGKVTYPTVTVYQVVKFDKTDRVYKPVNETIGANVTQTEDGISVTAANASALADTLNTWKDTTKSVELERKEESGQIVYKSNTKEDNKLDAGIWLVQVTGSTKFLYNPAIISVDQEYSAPGAADEFGYGTLNLASGWEPTAYLKKSEPKITKTVLSTNADNVQYGNELEFQLVSHIPSYTSDRIANAAGIKYTISDTLTGLTLVEATDTNVTAKINGVANDELKALVIAAINKAITDQASTFTVDFKDNQTLITSNLDKDITITYKAKVSSAAQVAVDLINNKAVLQYSTNGTTDEDVLTKDSETKHYTFGFGTNLNANDTTKKTNEFYKINEDGSVTTVNGNVETVTVTNPLQGAEFQLHIDTENGALFSNSKGNTFVTDASGRLEINGLDADVTYVLVETKAPTGYSLSDKKVTVKIEAHYTEGVLTGHDVVFTVDGTSYKSEYTYAAATKTTTVKSVTPLGFKNTTLSSLPSTGGIGTTIFTIGGCAIMILAAGLYFASRRRSAK